MVGNPLLNICRRLMSFILILIFCWNAMLFVSSAYGYDPLDPNGIISIKWDIRLQLDDSQDVLVSIYNYQLFRHIDPPGWRLSWKWRGKEVIWNMIGAETTEQGNCSAFSGGVLPHCCEKEPVIVDLLPGAPFNKQVANCCKGGVLSSMIQDPEKFGAAFQMNIGKISNTTTDNLYPGGIPGNFSLGLPGYTCGDPFQVPPSKFFEDQGRRTTQALATWNVTCSFSQFQASNTPTCCVSLSAFYNETVVPCPKCSCSCLEQPGQKCVNGPDDLPNVLHKQQQQQQHKDSLLQPAIQCTHHMCPVKVHWHVKVSYKEYWRVKITITNLNYVRNYSQWSLVVLHPNLRSVYQVYSFNYKPLNQYGDINDTGMFYGVKMYNDMLIQSGENGVVQTEMLLRKEAGIFTFREGWAFPRKISFNGQDCVMPQPEDYPRLPNTGRHLKPTFPFFILFLLPIFILYLFLS